MKLIRNFRPWLASHRFLQSVITLAGGTAIAQLMAVIATPVLTRLYSPEDFGVLAVFVGVVSIYSVIASLRYQLAILIPERDEEALHVAILCVLLVCLTTMLMFLAIYWVDSGLFALLGVPELEDFPCLLPIAGFSAGMLAIFTNLVLRKKNFGNLAASKVLTAGVTVLTQLIGYKFGGISLTAGQIAGQVGGGTRLVILSLREYPLRRISLRRLCEVATRYRKFPQFDSWAAMANTMGAQLPPILFSALFGPAAAGAYMLANRVLGMPLGVIGQSVASVFFSDAAEANRKGQLPELLYKLNSVLVNISVIPALLFVLVAVDLFAVLFGEQWREAGELAQWMAPWLWAVFVTSPVTNLFAVLARQKEWLIFQALLLVSRVAAIIVGHQIGDVVTTVALFSLVSAILWVLLLLYMARLVSGRSTPTAFMVLKGLLVGGVCVAPFHLAAMFPSAGLSQVAGTFLTLALSGVYFWRYFKSMGFSMTIHS